MKLMNLKFALVMVPALWLLGCGNGSNSYSILPSAQSFTQSMTDTKMDILWVIDNSGSMRPSQDELATNFGSFIQDFSSKNFDYQISVVTSDAYRAYPAFNNGSYVWSKAAFKDGTNQTSHTGVFIINPLTSNLINTFMVNITQGISGNGDERPFQSFKAALDSANPGSYNQAFRRPGSFLAIILVTDEDDFSNDTNTYLENQYNNPSLHTVASYDSWLSTLTGSSTSARRYSVSAMTIPDQNCLTHIQSQPNNPGGQKIGQRVMALANLTKGAVGSLCGNFGDTLQDLADNILSASTQFYLDREPIPSSIQVFVNGVSIPNEATNPAGDGGWTYNAEAQSIVFSGGAYIPPQNSNIYVAFDPVGLDF